ncbi:MAG: hypothetical protein ACD_79C00738G0002 [uncultured bacterium]|nr:MAG: hypothetical protein ACD_79C00738G0002 [uncultured bacterium]
MMKTIEHKRKLFDIADAQMGYFTTSQAEEAGFKQSNFNVHIKNKNWKKEYHGIYRLSDYPITDYEDYMVWYLWSRNRAGIPQGVFSNQTALSLYNLSEVNPSKIHLTVPENFRRSGEIPNILILYKQNIKEGDKKQFCGFQITTPLKTILDVIEQGALSNEFIHQAIVQADKRGLILKKHFAEFPILKAYAVR